MALQINESITTREGFTLSDHYIRLEYTHSRCGGKVEIEWYHYATKALFQAGAQTVVKNERLQFDYDSITDGTDMVAFAHSKLTEYLTTSQGTDENGDALAPRYDSANVSTVDL